MSEEYLKIEKLDELKKYHESDEQWRLRRAFIERHISDYPSNRLLCLSQIFININFLGCKYDEELTAKVKEMGAGLFESVSEAARNRRSFDKGFVKASEAKKPKIESKSARDIIENSPCALKRKNFVVLRAQLKLAIKETDPFKSLNQLTSRLKMGWDLRSLDDGKAALRINDVTILEGLFPQWNDDDVKNFAAAAALSIISQEDADVRAKNGSFEMWRGSIGPCEAYTEYIINSLKKVTKLLPNKGNTFEGLESALQSVRMPLRYISERGTGWEQKVCIKALNVELIRAVLKKGDCAKAREKAKKDELANFVVAKLTSPSMKVITTPNGLMLEI